VNDVAEGSGDLTCYIPSNAPSDLRDDQGECPHKLGWVFVDRGTGEIRPARCGRNRCSVCGPINAWLIGQAIGQAKPERMIRLSLVGDDWSVIRPRVFRFRYEIVQSGYRNFHWVWSIEPNPKGTGHHLHGYQRGEFVPQRVVCRVADSVGMGANSDIRKWRPRGDGSVTYNSKLALGSTYGMKLVERSESLNRYLDCNGGRLVHASRGFWLDASGKPTTQKGAIESWRNARGEGDNGRWELFHRSHLARAVTT
jgi:hypothetical protein